MASSLPQGQLLGLLRKLFPLIFDPRAHGAWASGKTGSVGVQFILQGLSFFCCTSLRARLTGLYRGRPVEGFKSSAPLVALTQPSSQSSLGLFCLGWESASSFEVSHISLPAPSEITGPPLAVTGRRVWPVGLILLPGKTAMAWLP